MDRITGCSGLTGFKKMIPVNPAKSCNPVKKNPIIYQLIADAGQAGTQILQALQAVPLINAFPLTMEIASTGHTSTHLPQPVQRSGSTLGGILLLEICPCVFGATVVPNCRVISEPHEGHFI